MMVVVLAEILGGLGLLFFGLKTMSGHLQNATGRRVRALLRAATRSPLVGLVCGMVAGAATQSSNAVALICGNLVRGGVFTTRDAIPVVAGGNVGTAALVFVAAFDFRLVVFYLLALVGFGFHFKLDRRPAWKEWIWVALGLTLALLGLDFIKQGPRDLDVALIARALDDGLSPWIGFAIGMAAAALCQSSSTPTILVLALMQAKLLGFEDAFFIVLGANLGSGLATLISSGELEGTGRQLCYVHILVKAIGCAVLLAAWIAVTLAGGDPEAALAASGGADSARAAVSMLFLVLQLAGAVPVSLGRRLTERIARYFSPPSVEDDASRPRYIHRRAAEEAATALDLSERESARLIKLLPNLLPDLDRGGADYSRQDRTAFWKGSTAIALAVDHFLVDVIRAGATRESLDIALQQQARLETIRALVDTLHDFSGVVAEFRRVPPLAFNLSESLRTIVLSLADATDGGAADDFDLLIALTADRSEMLDRIRRALAASAPGAEEDSRRLMHATSLFERAVWLVRRVAVALRPPAIEDRAPEGDPARQETPEGVA
ncbi:Na/Pi symporter [Xanthobacter tagetidis]|uniref:Na/Pi cotransporter family protein n=1 Tax=Xanthobacter tagetidis TaxID=60216 RepID=A0A3L6ZYY9_9HYPH|nr:Na/Pi symporter [Xanthobacter tagetidis]MBB6310264.1 phosphate:Na+ symporter [Xanthobacter tagetidis]RLP72651.1 Na/Pi cotransporter family protein [Xanthobacter tagetidis]